jgi:hypothetical protein
MVAADRLVSGLAAVLRDTPETVGDPEVPPASQRAPIPSALCEVMTWITARVMTRKHRDDGATVELPDFMAKKLDQGQAGRRPGTAGAICDRRILIMRCTILVTTADSQIVAGTVSLDDGRITVEASEGHRLLMQGILGHANLIDGGKRKVTAKSDPKLWFEALPKNYDGSYLRAAIDPDPFCTCTEDNMCPDCHAALNFKRRAS